MSGNIQNVNLQKLDEDIYSFAQYVFDVYGHLLEISDNIKTMSTYWTGKRINSVINLWNNSSPKLYEGHFYFWGKINTIIQEIWNQYNSMENGYPHDINLQNGGYNQDLLKKIPLTDSTTIKFDKGNVERVKTNIEELINLSNSKVSKFVDLLDEIATYSDSLKSLAINYKSNATNITSTLKGLQNNLLEEIQKAINDVDVTESYNEADAKRASTTSK